MVRQQYGCKNIVPPTVCKILLRVRTKIGKWIRDLFVELRDNTTSQQNMHTIATSPSTSTSTSTFKNVSPTAITEIPSVNAAISQAKINSESTLSPHSKPFTPKTEPVPEGIPIIAAKSRQRSRASTEATNDREVKMSYILLTSKIREVRERQLILQMNKLKSQQLILILMTKYFINQDTTIFLV